MICEGCKKRVKIVCKDGFCKNCHVSCSWEDCISNTFNAKILLKNGHSFKEIKKIYPKVNI